MFRDTKKELKRLQDELLAEEETKVLPSVDPEAIREARRQARLQQEQEALRQEQENLQIPEDPDELEDLADWLQMDEEELQAILGTEPVREPVYRNYSNGYGAVQTPAEPADDYDPADVDVYGDTEEEEDPEPPRQGVKGLIVTALCLLAGILGVMLWWVVRYF